MKEHTQKLFKNYFFLFLLISSIVLGGLTGCYWGFLTPYLKPFGDIFLNLIFTAIIPLIFFSIASAIARLGSMGKLGKVMVSMTLVFLFTSIIAAVYALFIVKIFPPAQGINISLPNFMPEKSTTVLSQLAGTFTVTEFSKLLSHEHILALMLFSILVGISASQAGEKSRLFIEFLHAGEDIFMRVFTLIMYYAPIGFFAYFAVLIHDLGPQLMHQYLRVALLYYSFALVYFILAFTLYAFLAGKSHGVKLFWQNIFLPTLTSIATCSSAASIPANLIASKQMHVPDEVCETTIPLGAMVHKDGSVIGGVFKIAFLFGIFHWDFTGASVLLTALGVSLLVGTVMGAIPSGGMLGELLILSIYGFPPSVLMVIAAISIIIDPIATMLNVTCNTVSSMLVARMVEGKAWINQPR